MGARKYYKDKYFLVFYDKADEELLYLFDNVNQLCDHLKLERTRRNVNNLNVRLFHALRSETHFFRMSAHETCRVYMISVDDEEDDENQMSDMDEGEYNYGKDGKNSLDNDD